MPIATVVYEGQVTLLRVRSTVLSYHDLRSAAAGIMASLRPIMDQRYTLWTVDVSGPLDDLDIQRRALDGVGNAIEQLFQGMNTGTEAKRKDRSAGIGRMFR